MYDDDDDSPPPPSYEDSQLEWSRGTRKQGAAALGLASGTREQEHELQTGTEEAFSTTPIASPLYGSSAVEVEHFYAIAQSSRVLSEASSSGSPRERLVEGHSNRIGTFATLLAASPSRRLGSPSEPNPILQRDAATNGAKQSRANPLRRSHTFHCDYCGLEPSALFRPVQLVPRHAEESPPPSTVEDLQSPSDSSSVLSSPSSDMHSYESGPFLSPLPSPVASETLSFPSIPHRSLPKPQKSSMRIPSRPSTSYHPNSMSSTTPVSERLYGAPQRSPPPPPQQPSLPQHPFAFASSHQSLPISKRRSRSVPRRATTSYHPDRPSQTISIPQQSLRPIPKQPPPPLPQHPLPPLPRHLSSSPQRTPSTLHDLSSSSQPKENRNTADLTMNRGQSSWEGRPPDDQHAIFNPNALYNHAVSPYLASLSARSALSTFSQSGPSAAPHRAISGSSDPILPLLVVPNGRRRYTQHSLPRPAVD